MRWRSAWLVASSAVLVLAGCGGSASPPPKAPPRIPSAVAQKLAADADTVAAQKGCAAHDPAVKLLDDVIAATSRIPSRYQEPLTSAANDLVARVPACPAPEPQKKGKRKHGHGKHKGHERGGDD
jgi:hypothetical protein